MSGSDHTLVEPQHHEYSANLNFQHLDTWIACDSVVKSGDGSVKSRFEWNGHPWEVKLYYQESALMPPKGDTTAAGTRVNHDTIREFRLHVTAQDDDIGQRSANYHVRPRWADLRAETDSGVTRIPVPDSLANDGHDAVSVRVSGSNMSMHKYHDLLAESLSAVGISPRYVADLHDTSNTTQAALHVRLHRDLSGPVHARTGPIVQLAHLLQDDRSGYRKLVQNDEDNHGSRLPGFYHTATIGQERVREVMPDHNLAVEIKHYYAKEARERDPGDPLAHPKLEISLKSNLTDQTVGADQESLEDLITELEEWLYAVLAEAELDTRAGGGLYVSDQYFQATNAATQSNVISMDLTEIRHDQEAVVYHHLAGGMSPTERDTLQYLVTDGGDTSPQELANATDRHQDSVYAALQSMHDLVQHEYGSVSLQSTYLSELVADALEQAEAAVTRATNAAAEAVRAEERGLDERTSAFVAWAEKHGLNHKRVDGDVAIELGQVKPHDGQTAHQKVRKILREGLELWRDMGRDEAEFRAASVAYRYHDSTISGTRMGAGTVWRLIR